MSDQRLPIFPTRMNLKIIETREKSAEKGKTLLKRKSDALKQKLRTVEEEYRQKEASISKQIKDAFFKLTEAEFHGANINMFVHECQKYPISVTSKIENISGVKLVSFDLEKSNVGPIFFLDRNGKALNECRKMFIVVLESMIELCALRNSYRILDEIILGTNRRVNALGFNVLPKLQNTINYINSELDEQDREDFFRLKKIQNLKNK